MNPQSREDLKQYCLRELGAPVLEINVDDDQLEDRIDQALDYWRLYHYDGTSQMYLKQPIRASELTLTTNNAQSFNINEIITGATSGARAICTQEIQRASAGNLLLVKNGVGTFVAGETVTGDAGNTATVGTGTPYVLREYDKKYIDLPDYVYGVTRMIYSGQASSSKNMFDLQYQLRLNDLYDLTSTSIIYYTEVMQHLALLDLTLNGKPLIRFNRMEGRLYPDINWATNIVLGQYILIEGQRALDPNEWSRIWNENWMKRYTTQLFKRQWGTNLKKFSGIALPGGVTLNGDTLYQEADVEIKSLEQELMTKSAPLEFFMG